LIAPAEAAQIKDRVAALEERAKATDDVLRRLDMNMARVMDRLGVPQDPGLPPIRTSSPGR